MPRLKVVHGRWGELYLNGTELIAEATGIDYTIDIERVDVAQAGTRWGGFTEGVITGTGTLRLNKVYSRWEDAFMDYVAKSPAELRELRNDGAEIRPAMTLMVALDSPHAVGRETETLKDVLFWSYSGGFSLTDIVQREWPFSFEGVTPGTRIAAP